MTAKKNATKKVTETEEEVTEEGIAIEDFLDHKISEQLEQKCCRYLNTGFRRGYHGYLHAGAELSAAAMVEHLTEGEIEGANAALKELALFRKNRTLKPKE